MSPVVIYLRHHPLPTRHLRPRSHESWAVAKLLRLPCSARFIMKADKRQEIYLVPLRVLPKVLGCPCTIGLASVFL
jgi:hypothetical protein